MIVRPDVRVNEFGVYAYAPNIGSVLTGRTVEIRDWYVTFRATVEGVHISERSGYPYALALTLEDGRKVPSFSLHLTREIELIS